MSDPVIIGVIALVMFVIGSVLIYSSHTNSKFASLFSPAQYNQLTNRVFDFGDNLLVLGLKQAATTDSPLDDEFFMTAITLRGGSYTGSPETGYTVTIPPRAHD